MYLVRTVHCFGEVGIGRGEDAIPAPLPEGAPPEEPLECPAGGALPKITLLRDSASPQIGKTKIIPGMSI